MELSGRISRLTRDGLPIWVNFANVLYVQSVKVRRTDEIPVTPAPGLGAGGRDEPNA